MNEGLACLAALIFIGMVGCQQKGPMEKAGERMDEVVDNIQDGDAPFKKKGTMEKMGESIDESVDKVSK